MSSTSPVADIERAIPKIRERILSGIDRKEPTANIWVRAQQPTVFDGSYDWHSSIAAHWSLLSMARLLEDKSLSKSTVARLPIAALEKELALIAKNAEPVPQDGRVRVRTSALFQPYVEAWFLLLIDELQRHEGPDAAQLAKLRVEAEQLLLAALESGSLPEVRENMATGTLAAFLGTYRSQLFGGLALHLAKPTTPEHASRFAAWKAQKLDPVRSELAALPEPSSRDFLDVGAIVTLITCLESNGEKSPSTRTFATLPAQLPTIREIHPVGAAISQTWPYAAASGKSAECRSIFESRIKDILAREDLWAEDFSISSHWLPQFLWFGISLHLESLRGTPAPAPATAEAVAAKPKPKLTPIPKPGTPAPTFAMTDRDGKPVTIEQFAGKVIVLDFWATWCGPCKEALPHLQELATHYATQDVVVIASCTNDERAKFDAWVDEHGGDLPNIVFAHDPLERSADRASAKLYGVMMIPITFVIGRDGKICKAVGGYRKGEVLVDAALATAGIEVPAETLEKAKKDEESRRGPGKVEKKPTPAKAEADSGGK